MTTRTRTPTILALLIAAVLAGAYLIVVNNNAAMNGTHGEASSGFVH